MTATRTSETFSPDLQIDLIRASSTNPRQHFDPAGLDELKASIAQLGINVPLLVRQIETGGGYIPHGDEVGDELPGRFVTFEYELISGERRLRAARELGLDTVPAIIREMTDAEARELQIVENLQRAEVHPVEEAEAYRLLITDSAAHGFGRDRTAEDIAKRVGKPTAHVAKLLKLLDLEIDAKLLFSKGAITINHALLLAPLTPADQDRALRFMLNSDPKYDKRPVTAIVRHALGLRAEGEAAEDVSADDEEGDEDDDAVSYNMPKPQVVKYMRAGRRVIDATEAQLKRWIEANVLLKLADVPWRLDDDDLVKLAGACDVCPKRSGSNIALFGQLTAEEDVCTDSVCFELKQKAILQRHKDTARGKILKITSKPSSEKLAEIAVQRLPLRAAGGPVVGESVYITKKTVCRGQWVAAELGSCPAVVEAVMVDGADKGKLVPVCADQGCKVHKHQVQTPRATASSSSNGESPEKRVAREALEKKLVDDEKLIRRTLYSTMLAGLAKSQENVLRRFVMANVGQSDAGFAHICETIGLAFPKPKQEWQREESAAPVLAKYVAAATPEQLARVAFEELAGGSLEPDEWAVVHRIADDRKELWALAKAVGVDADAIAAMVIAPKASRETVAAKAVPAKKAVAKPAAAKKVALKPTAKKAVVAKKAATPKKLTPEGRKRIADEMKKRWAQRRKAAAK